MDSNIFNEIFGSGFLYQDKNAMKDLYINQYIKGQITKEQLDERMRGLSK